MSQNKTMVIGSRGKMGQEIVSILQENNIPFIEVDARAQSGVLDSPKACKEKVSVVIDFSTSEAFGKNLTWCLKNKVPFVSGTTNLKEADFKILKESAQEIPVLWSANMSLGIAFLRQSLKNFHQLKGQFDFQIEEAHHKHKKDAPSGTAKTLQKDLEAIFGAELPPVLSIRGGGIFGVHKVYAMSEDEVILFQHEALNRSVFAKGAVMASQWIIDQDKGLYSIEDVLHG